MEERSGSTALPHAACSHSNISRQSQLSALQHGAAAMAHPPPSPLLSSGPLQRGVALPGDAALRDAFAAVCAGRPALPLAELPTALSLAGFTRLDDRRLARAAGGATAFDEEGASREGCDSRSASFGAMAPPILSATMIPHPPILPTTPSLPAEGFLRAAAALAAGADTPCDVLAAFAAFDPGGTGTLPLGTLQTLLGGMGPPPTRLPPDLVGSLLELAAGRGATAGGGKGGGQKGPPPQVQQQLQPQQEVDYRALVAAVFAQHDELQQRRALERAGAAAGAAKGRAGALKR